MDPEFDARDLRRAFGKLATGVTVVTAVLPGGRKLGLTANSFCERLARQGQYAQPARPRP